MRLATPAHIWYSPNAPKNKWGENHRMNAKTEDWHRRTYSWAIDTPSRDKDKIYISHFESLGPRWVKDAHEVARLDHTGWYTDEFQNELLIGVVLCFSRKGRDCFLAGTRHTGSDGVTVDSYTYDDEKEAARAADSMAEYAAEEELEWDRKESLKMRIEDLTDELKESRISLRKLLREYNVLKRKIRSKTEDMFDNFKFQSPILCEALESKIKRDLEHFKDDREELRGLQEEL